MADSKISALTDGNPPLAADIMVVARAGNLTRRVTLAQLTTLVAAAIIDGGSNEISVAGLAGLLATAQTPAAHKTSHQDVGADEIDVTGLSGLLADAQTPLTENVQDIVGAMFTDTATIDCTYTDATGLETLDIKAASVTEAMQVLANNTTQDVTSTKHGYVPKAPADSTKFLDGSATPVFDTVKDSDLALTDITTNDVSITAHGFAPKAPSDATKFLNGANPPAWTVPAGGAAATVKHYASDDDGLTFNTDNTERTVLSFTLTAGDFAAGKKLFIFTGGNMLQNSGTPTWRWRLKIGATTVYDEISGTITGSATRRSWYFEAFIGETGTNTQAGWVKFQIGAADTATVGTVGFGAAGFLFGGGHFTSAVDVSGSVTVAVTITQAVSNISCEYVGAFAEALLVG
jgi:hypothetical protein